MRCLGITSLPPKGCHWSAWTCTSSIAGILTQEGGSGLGMGSGFDMHHCHQSHPPPGLDLHPTPITTFPLLPTLPMPCLTSAIHGTPAPNWHVLGPQIWNPWLQTRETENRVRIAAAKGSTSISASSLCAWTWHNEEGWTGEIWVACKNSRSPQEECQYWDEKPS